MTKEAEHRIVAGVIEGLLSKGLVVVTAEMADAALQHKKAVDRLMRKASLTAYEVAKFNLVGTRDVNTVKNMIADGRINKAKETFIKNGKLCITNACIKRLRDA